MTSRSTDGGQTWQRPFDNIPLFDFKAMTDRTDYEVTGRQSLTAHMSCTEVSDAACVRESSYAITTDDGGVTWNGSLPKSDFLHLLPASPCLGTGVEAADLGAFPVTRPVKE
jgi:Neuraminidase (sialidase)